MNTSTRKSTLTLVTLPSFSISGEISAEKMYVENWEIYRRLYDWGHALFKFSAAILEKSLYCPVRPSRPVSKRLLSEHSRRKKNEGGLYF